MVTQITTSNARIDIWKKLKSIDNVPTLPSVFFKLERLLGDENISMNAVTKVVEEDPPMVAKILQRINSGYYFFSKEITGIQQAIVLLGATEIRNLIAELGVLALFNEIQESKYFNFNKFWQHASATAHIAVAICKQLGISFKSQEFTAGLLHDFGRLILCMYFNEMYQKVFKYSSQRQISLFEAEKRMLNITHAEIGEWLAKNWKLPEDITDVIANHHDIKTWKIQENPLWATVALSDKLANMWGYTLQTVPVITTIEADTIWQEFSRIYPKIHHFPVDDLGKILNMPPDEAIECPNPDRVERLKADIQKVGLGKTASLLLNKLMQMRPNFQASAASSTEALAQVAAIIKHIIGFDLITIYRFDLDKGELQTLYTQGEPSAILDTINFRRGLGAARWVYQHGERFRIAANKPPAEESEKNTQALMAVPLFSGKTLTGVMLSGSFESSAYSEKHLLMLAFIAEFLGRVVK